MGRLIEFESEFGTYTLAFEKAEYVYGGLAIEVHDNDEGWWEPYGTLTKNLMGFAVPPRCAFVDANNLRDLCDMVVANGWAVPIGEAKSGYCTYPLVEFTDEFLDEICYGEGDEL